MRRRRYLQAVSTTAAALSLTGCTGEGGDGNAQADDDTDTSADGGNRQVDAAIATAVGELNTAVGELDAAQTRFAEDRSVEFEGVADRIETARSELDDAEPDASDDQGAAIEEVRAYAAVVAAMNDAFLTLVDTEDGAETVQSAVESEEYDRAGDLVDDLSTETGDARSTLEGASDAAEGLDADTLESRDSVEIAKVRDGYDQLTALAAGFDALATAYGDLIDGRAALAEGRAHADESDYSAAAESFGDAEASFDAGTATATDALDASPPERVAAELRALSCRGGHLSTAAGHFRASAEAAADRDRSTAREEREAAEDALDAVTEC
jgi:hypothetical protein